MIWGKLPEKQTYVSSCIMHHGSVEAPREENVAGQGCSRMTREHPIALRSGVEALAFGEPMEVEG